MKAMVKDMQLDESQKPVFLSISKKYGHHLMELKDSKKSKWSKYRKMKSLIKSRNKEMKKLLSNEQYKIYLDKQKEMQKKMSAKN